MPFVLLCELIYQILYWLQCELLYVLPCAILYNLLHVLLYEFQSLLYLRTKMNNCIKYDMEDHMV